MINIYHLKYFVDAAKDGSLSAAAQKNRISQSAVSQAIRSLERSIRFSLIAHQKKVFHLTDEGKALLAHSDQIFQAIEGIQQAIEHIGTAYTGRLAIGCTNSVAVGLVPSILASLSKDHPALQVIVRVGNSETIKDWLLQGQIELGIMVDDDKITSDFMQTSIFEGEYVLFHAKKRKVNFEKLIVTRRERKEIDYFLRKLRNVKPQAKIQYELTSWEAIKYVVMNSDACGICPDYVIRSEIARGKLSALKTAFRSPRYKLLAVRLARKPIGKNTALFLKLISLGGSG